MNIRVAVEEVQKQIDIIVSNIDNISLEEIKNKLLVVEKELNYLYEINVFYDEDYRTGFETYGYDSLDDIKNQITYISDRWNCAFRIAWLLDFIKFYDEIKKF